MAEKRFIVSPRKGAAGRAGVATASFEAAVAAQPGADLVRTTPKGRHVITATDEAAKKLARENPHLVVEEDKPIEPYRMPGLPPVMLTALDTADTVFTVRVRGGNGRPIPDVTVYAVGPDKSFRGVTGADGIAQVGIENAEIGRIVASPRHSYWSTVLNGITVSDEPIDVVLPPLQAGPAAAWIHRLLGVDQGPQGPTGRGVSVAVIDSGRSPDARTIHAVAGMNALDDADPQQWRLDEEGHGTHCAGLIAARPLGPNDTRGIAPGVTLSVLKVLPGGFTSDLVQALEWCALNHVDIANMSLGSPDPAEALEQALIDAQAQGVTVIAAAGNSSAPVGYPAAYASAIAVSALGRFGTFPETSGHSLKIGPHRDWWGGLFDAKFTNFGPQVNVCAPGVAIPSTVPGGYAAWDGTSMACPLVTGLAALVLEACPWLRTGTAEQSQMLRWALTAGAANTGFPPEIQGYGLPTLPRAIAAAQQMGVLAASQSNGTFPFAAAAQNGWQNAWMLPQQGGGWPQPSV
jgi:hypothetical protein